MLGKSQEEAMRIIKVSKRNYRIVYDGTSPDMVARASALAVALGARGFSVSMEEE